MEIFGECPLRNGITLNNEASYLLINLVKFFGSMTQGQELANEMFLYIEASVLNHSTFEFQAFSKRAPRS